MTKITERETVPAPSGRLAQSVLLFSRALLDDHNRRYLLLGLLALFLTFIIIPKGGFIPDYYAPGDIASRDVKASRDMLIPDQELTEAKRNEARGMIAPLYDFDPRTGPDIADRVTRGIALLQRPAADVADQRNLHAQSDALLGLALTAQERAQLAAIPADTETLRRIEVVISSTLGVMIVGNLDLFNGDRQQGVAVRNLVTGDELALPETVEVLGYDKALEQLDRELTRLHLLGAASRRSLTAVVKKMLRPDLTFNQSETENRRRQAAESVTPVLFQVKKGEMIVREGERVNEEQVKKLKALAVYGHDYSSMRTATGLLLAIVILFFSLHRFAKRNIRKYRPGTRDLAFMALVCFLLFILLKISIFISTALESAFPYIDSTSYYYLFPFAAGAMLVRIIINSETALVFSVIVSTLIGILFGNNLLIALYALAGGLVGAHFVRQCSERSILYAAGLRLSLANMLLVVAIHLLAGRPFDVQIVYKLLFAFASGPFCAILVTGTIPAIESLFRYTTDIKLLELANMNNPALRELMIQAPGTYHHSIVVGNLVESAAEAINANPLLARVAAYYHDIGKAKKPLYFIENIRDHENKHDKLAPSMSALILTAHVKDGVEMAREQRLGDALIDIIQQHHGTAMMKFFYEKAKAAQDPTKYLDEREFRYPGPKPQTREAALIMLADAVEAASRTLVDPTAARIQGMVQKIINNIFIDGQLDECELTLKDLHQIARCFNQILAGIYHHRIDYPEPAYKERDKDGAKRRNGEDPDRESAKEPKDREAKPAKSGSDDLKRLGMS